MKGESTGDKYPMATIENYKRLCKDVTIAFSPRHSMIEHQPARSVNKVRRMVYRALAKERANFEQASL